MNIFSFKRIRTRLIVWFLLISLTPLLLAILITYDQRVSVIETRTLDKLTAIRDLKVERLQGWLQERSSDLEVMSSDAELSSLKNIISKDNSNPDRLEEFEIIRKFIQHYLESYSDYSEIFIIHPLTGKVLISTNPKMEGKDKSDYDYFIKPQQSGKLFIQDIYHSKTLLSHAMAFSAPIFYSLAIREHLIGVLVARVDLDHVLYPMLLDKIGLGETGETLIVNSDIIALNALRWHENAPLKLQIKALPAVYASQGMTGTATVKDYRGEEVLAAYTYIPETGWGFVSKQDVSELRAPIREMIGNTLILFIASLIIIVLLAFRLSTTFSKPVIGMDALAKKITDGDYTVRNVINSQDELGSLAKSINDMIEEIQEWSSELNVKVKERTEELETKNAELERFTYTVSHDLKSPLVTIKGFIGLLEKDSMEGNQKRMSGDIKRINEAANIMAALLDELLEFSRIGRLDNPHEEISMFEMVNETVELLSGRIVEAKIKVDIQPDLPSAFADRPRIREVIQNLIENAAKFMGEQPAPHIEVGSDNRGGEVVYYVRDNGIGIDKAYHEKVFGMFERLDTTIDGTGMGLALVKRIIEVHGGRIWVESAGVGSGCTFCFTLPQKEIELDNKAGAT
ncbi:His Kinase A (phospho-acceptor) domain-containing protein [Mariprofundus aestuarium]|uniref:histidine kinase n=1 Tax=Mariprofundus aestuarium TaxID=1921086 RepID=A0A2K8L667_MARES|nr:ATP-binding protein [Mariprofundus aestuarium]ATX79726.1 His Kinase A (phospho-acceptor) domain-containing protein [Mariprofundus aestuarium]